MERLFKELVLHRFDLFELLAQAAPRHCLHRRAHPYLFVRLTHPEVVHGIE